MTLTEVQLLLQSISSFALAGGLIFTGLQLWRSRKMQYVANFTKMVELQMHLREMRVHAPDLAKVYGHDVRDLANDTEVREYFFNLMQLSVYEIVWFAHRNGSLPDDYYRSWEKRMAAIAAEPSFRSMMANPSMKILHDDFQNYVQELVARTPEIVHAKK